MAKKRRTIQNSNDSQNNQNFENDNFDTKPEYTPEEIESVKNYQPLHLSLKFHIIIAAVLFVMFYMLYIGYEKTVKYLADKQIADGIEFLKIAEYLDKEDTGALVIYQESESYQKINQLSSYIGRDLTNIFDFLKMDYIPDTFAVMLKDTKLLIPEVVKVISERSGYFKGLNLMPFIKRYEDAGLNLSSKIDAILDVNKQITDTQNVKKYKRNLHKNITEIKSDYFELENQTLRLRGLWNRGASFDAALELFQKAISIDNRNIEAYYNLGNIYELMKEPELAGERYCMVLKIKPDSKLAEQLIQKFSKAIEANPDDMQNRYNLGVSYSRKKMKDKAREQFKIIIDKDPDKKTTLSYMSEVRLKEIDSKSPETIYDPRF
ncbi:MAG TPA: tetratricopeptide repeat protein [bacterium]|nr:tetratricopeptide repeat protein [bacterium]HPN30266.1 tetratricopeptide repeat protein [bacterium]